MEPKAELLVFNKKEILVIISLLVLVALFSFTLGLKLGKTLGASAKPAATEHAPLGEHAVEGSSAHAPTEAAPGEHGEEASENRVEATKPVASPEAAPAEAQDKADAEFAAEADKEKVGAAKTVPMAFPKDKKGETIKNVRYTLQVGSHRTVAEATEQVSGLKRKGLDAFYIEATVPGKGTWYRVGIGVFNSKEEAERGAVEWKKKGLPAHIVQKIGE